MTVKVRKVGNSYTLTIPSEAVRRHKITEGQELDVIIGDYVIEYHIKQSIPSGIEWEKYQHLDSDIRDGATPDEYVRGLRDNDR